MRAYVGTYAKYNNGSLKGGWVELADFQDTEDFYEYCKSLHSDEADPEFIVQSWEDAPPAFRLPGIRPTSGA
jgi:antirestriction protein